MRVHNLNFGLPICDAEGFAPEVMHLYTCLQILSVTVFEKTPLSCALRPDRTQPELVSFANQLNLFEI